MDAKVCSRRRRSEGGFTLFEALIVIGIISIVAAVGIPQMTGARRLLRSSSVTRELIGGLRDARQLAISRRRAVTFQYDDDAKQVNIIDHGTDAQGVGISGTGVLTAGNYPNTARSSVASTTALTSSGLPAEEIAYGVPAGVPTGAKKLSDNVTLSTLTNNKLNVTFQPDGTIISAAGVTRDVALSIYNTEQPYETAAAISVLGATGRIKAWRYSGSANKYIE
jgi:Tfp pilus assembly protein FimT